ncbi:hypothetical protein DH2020_027175 [Rehmannia glutinosa]|uniref:PIR2-like helical domain-containing protein n=1 Tax=Rehmannia glutinosa TaxID=99300 RepID=A0ABR0VYD7_REHGL
MAGSKGGKHPKSKGKSKSKKSDTINKKPEVINSKLDLAQILNNNPHGPKDYKGKNPQPNMNSPMTSSRPKYTEKELEEFLYVKFERLYSKAREYMLESGYGMADVERAILNNGYVHGPLDLLNNVTINLTAFIEQKVEAKREAFKDMNELYKTMQETLVESMKQTWPNMQRFDAMCHLLLSNWGFEAINTVSHLQYGDQNANSSVVHGSYGSSSYNKNEDASAPDSSSTTNKVLSELDVESSSKNVGTLERINLTPVLLSRLKQNIPILAAIVQREIGDPVFEQQAFQRAGGEQREDFDIMGSDFLTSITEACIENWLASDPDNPKIPLIIDLVKSIKDLQEKVNEQKVWAQQKVIDSAKKLSKHLLELNILRMEKVDVKIRTNEKMYVETSCRLKLMEVEQCLRNANCEASFITEAVRRLEIGNAQIKADIEALKLDCI